MSDQAISTSHAPHGAPERTGSTRTDLRVVQEAKKRSRARQVVAALAVVVIFSALLASAVFHSVLVSGQQRLDNLNQRVEQRQQVLSRAELRVAELSSPARIVAAAKGRGMVVPDHTTSLTATPPTAGAPSGPSLPAGKATSGPGSELATGGGVAPARQRAGSGRVR